MCPYKSICSNYVKYGISLKICRDVPTYTQIGMCVQIDAASREVLVTVKPVLSDHLNIDKDDLNDLW